MIERMVMLVLLSLPALTLASLPKHPGYEARVKALVAKRVSGPDVRVELERNDEGFCGSQGGVYFAHVEMRRPKKVLNEDSGETEIKNDHYEHVVTYYVPIRELSRKEPGLKAVASCEAIPDRTIELQRQ